MAKQVGTIQFTGKMDNFSFYHDSRNGYLVRRTGGVNSNTYNKDPRYQAARDASAEFSVVSRTGKLLRDALTAFIIPVKDGTMVNRLNKTLVELKQSDTTHCRAQRRPEVLMADPEAGKHFRIFQFNEGVKLFEILSCYPSVVSSESGILLKNISGAAITYPAGATHAGLTAIHTVIDFENVHFTTIASIMTLVSIQDEHEVALILPAISGVSGTGILCLQVLFFRQENGDLMQLSGKVHSMGIIQIEKV